MTRTTLILIATLGSFALLAGAFAFQAAGYAPCKMCLWQRWPHAIAIGIGALALAGRRHTAILAILGAGAAAVTSGIGLFHAGVEQGWWEGPTSCTGSGAGLAGLSGGDLLSLDGPAVVMCDQIAWQFAGVSMAGWNAVLSAILVGVWVAAALRRP